MLFALVSNLFIMVDVAFDIICAMYVVMMFLIMDAMMMYDGL